MYSFTSIALKMLGLQDKVLYLRGVVTPLQETLSSENCRLLSNNEC